MNYITSLLGVLGFLVAIVSLIVSFWQYKIHKRQLKTELFTKYCARYRIEDNIKSVVKFLKQEDGIVLKSKVREPDAYEIEMFMRYFEELELLIDAKSIDEEIVAYMFYNHLQSFVKMKDRWKNIDYDSDDWKIFHYFYARMKRVNRNKNNYKID